MVMGAWTRERNERLGNCLASYTAVASSMTENVLRVARAWRKRNLFFSLDRYLVHELRHLYTAFTASDEPGQTTNAR